MNILGEFVLRFQCNAQVFNCFDIFKSHYLCNLILLTGHVPAEFGLGVIHPILKCKSGNKTVGYDDFRGITISPVISKVLEKCILDSFGHYFWSFDNQFGFKSNVGCSNAIYCLRSFTDYFIDQALQSIYVLWT